MPDDLRWPEPTVIPRLQALPRTDQMVLVSNGDPWTLARLDVAADRLAAGMTAQGIRAGDRVALHLRNGPEIAVAYLACFRTGAIAAPLNLRFKQVELEDALSRLKPHLYLGQRDLYCHVAAIDPSVLAGEARFLIDTDDAPMARSWAVLLRYRDFALSAGSINPHAPAVLLMTSGTTGQSKFVAHSLATLTEAADRARHMGIGPGQRMVATLPMVHMSGLWMFLVSLRRGIHLVLCDADAGAILDTIEEDHCDILGTLPSVATALIEAQRNHPRDVSSLRLVISSGDAPPAGQQEAWAETFRCELRSFWASTEAVGSCTYATTRGAVSRLLPNTGMRLVDLNGTDVPPGEAGEMLLHGPHVTLGYWQAPGLLSRLADGWFGSGDLMRRDADDHIWFIGRLKDLIVRSGSNISPVEVEAVIASHAAVAEAGVVGVPDPILGQRVMAAVRLHGKADPFVLSDIMVAISRRLADYKLPERLFLVATLPRNALGKLDRRQLTAMLEERLAIARKPDIAPRARVGQ